MLCHSATMRVKRVSRIKKTERLLDTFQACQSSLTRTSFFSPRLRCGEKKKKKEKSGVIGTIFHIFLPHSTALSPPASRARAHSNFSHFLYSPHTEYTCHATWRENLTTFIIATHASTKHGVCISFRQQLSTDSAQLFIGDSCYRENQGLDNISDHPITLANLTNVGRKSDEWLDFYSTVSFNNLVSALCSVFAGKCGEISTSGKLTASWLIHSIAGAVLTSLWMMERLTLLHSTL